MADHLEFFEREKMVVGKKKKETCIFLDGVPDSLEMAERGRVDVYLRGGIMEKEGR